MSVASVVISGYCCRDETAKAMNTYESSCTRSKVGLFVQKHRGAIFLTELALAITAFVLGLLSLLSVVAIPAAASYAMLAAGAFILAMDIGAFTLIVTN